MLLLTSLNPPRVQQSEEMLNLTHAPNNRAMSAVSLNQRSHRVPQESRPVVVAVSWHKL